MNYEMVMGLEVHVELAAQTKLFCACSALFGAEPNQNVCPACCGMPGSPPVLNKRAVELGIIAATLVNGTVPPVMTFDKKNYFYPDLPAGYQITQNTAPVCTGGSVEIPTAQGTKTITLKQIHIEEDAGKLSHEPRRSRSKADYNRAGVPLIEIVSNPDFRTADEVISYLQKLQKLLSFAGVSDCKMQEGSMRCDVNISVRKSGAKQLGVRVEIKNMNSFKAIERAIAYESRRHIDALQVGAPLFQETRGWDDGLGETFAMREKADAHDYRYFPNPEIPPVILDEKWKNKILKSIPESAQEIFNRYRSVYKLSDYEAEILTQSKRISEIFQQTADRGVAPKDAAGWIITELLGAARQEKIDIEQIAFNADTFAHIIKLVKADKINRNAGKALLVLLIKDDTLNADQYLTQNNLYIGMDSGELDGIIAAIVRDNPQSVAEYKAGNEKVLTFFMGQIMKATRGKADHKTVQAILLKILSAQ
ncbi:MAG: Asp-tRNA(Asn)/Glu-tRNA(Gln) amidotransferase subunit GatB [Firmicutes bacterium]|nr:Asp-tRNA(Asn)/Glu-tRNA(Gln) amidotransferase subunit GatB [Bacillota bacterium]